jgi:hypothetical protein
LSRAFVTKRVAAEIRLLDKPNHGRISGSDAIAAIRVRTNSMTLHGHVQNGIIILDGNLPLPEGAAVEVQIMVPTPDQSATNGSETEIPTLAERLKDFIGVLEDLPEDAARNHDHYLYGTPKK